MPTIPDPIWQAGAWLEVDTASDRLLFQPDGETGRKYLIARGLHHGTWAAWQLGYAVVQGCPTIVIPWIDMNPQSGIITAVKYRFLEGDRGKRFAMRKGSVPLLFGLQHVLDYDETLMIIEGEMNALSVWQCLPSRVAVVSIGSEGGGHDALLHVLTQRFQNVFVWTDDIWDNPRHNRRAEELGALIKGKGRAVRSVKHGSEKLDANALLQRGQLLDFLTRLLGVECLGIIGQPNS